MRIISKKRLEDFTALHSDAAIPLKFWYDVIKGNSFYTSQEVIEVFKTADYVGNNRLVFNICHNKYCLVAKFEFKPQVQLVFIKFIGTHKEYDNIRDIKNI